MFEWVYNDEFHKLSFEKSQSRTLNNCVDKYSFQ